MKWTQTATPTIMRFATIAGISSHVGSAFLPSTARTGPYARRPLAGITTAIKATTTDPVARQGAGQPDPLSPHSARFWEPVQHPNLHDPRIQCQLCPRKCVLKNGQHGFCYVRKNKGGAMELITYGRSSGFCIDPIEKKPLNHFLPGSTVLSFGTAGCNLGCQFCQNWDISKAKHDDRLQSRASPEAIAQAALEAHCASVAYTYNDPVIFLEYASDVAQACKEIGVRSVAVTAGYISEGAREDFFSHMDAANVDLKGFTEKFYRKNCNAHLQPVLDTLEYLVSETSVWVEVTTLLIPGLNDSDAELEAQCSWMAEKLGPHVPLHFSAFHPDYKMQHIERTPQHTLTRARNIALKHGLKYVFTGNTHDKKGASTYCPSCNSLLVERDWFHLGQYNMHGNKCAKCGAKVHGVFPDQSPSVAGAGSTRPVLQRILLEQHAAELERRYIESRRDLMRIKPL